MEKINKKTILIAPLDWGLGHTTRCIAIIKTLQQANYCIIVAGNKKQQSILQQEFTNLQYLDLFGYNITYAKSKWFFAIKMILQIPKILWCIYSEHKWLQQLLAQQKIDLIISDNRYGLYTQKKPCIFITHQLKILTGTTFTNNITQLINYNFINKFTTCWVPDIENKNCIAGNLSHPKKMPKIPTHYIGSLSRFNYSNCTKEYDICILLSGPEPQRTLLENKILQQLKNVVNKKILFIRGLPNTTATINNTNCTIKNHLAGIALQQAICSSEFIVARSGYTTVMELLYLQKKMILIPTPMQTEQEYLAQYLQNKNWCLSFTQNNFDIHSAIQLAVNFDFNFATNILYQENIILNNVLKLTNNTTAL